MGKGSYKEAGQAFLSEVLLRAVTEPPLSWWNPRERMEPRWRFCQSKSSNELP